MKHSDRSLDVRKLVISELSRIALHSGATSTRRAAIEEFCRRLKGRGIMLDICECTAAGAECRIHAPITEHIEVCDNPTCSICHPQMLLNSEIVDAVFWTRPAPCCGRPLIVCDWHPCAVVIDRA